MKHFIVERDCYHGGVRYRKGQIVQLSDTPTVVQGTGKKAEEVPVRHFVPIGAQSVSVESPIQQELHSLEGAMELPEEALASLYSERGATSDREKLDALKTVVRETMTQGAGVPPPGKDDDKDKK